MIDLLLVDDEPAVVEALASTIDWKNLGFNNVHRALSACEALTITQENPIAVVVTDIKMPGMNGLELIGQIKESNPHTKCIVLSGYSDFEFTQEAIRLKSDGYLLKPVSDEKICEEVARQFRTYNEEWEEVSSYMRALSTLKEHLPLLQSQFLLELLSGNGIADAIDERLATLEIQIPRENVFFLLLVRIEGEEKDETNPVITEYGVMNLIRDLMGTRGSLWNCKDNLGNLVYLIQGEMENGLSRKISILQGNIKSHLHRKASIIVSKKGHFPRDLPNRYQGMLFAMRKMIGGDNGLCLFLEQTIPQISLQSSSLLYDFPSLHQLLEIPNWDGASERIQMICSHLKEYWPHSHEHLAEAFFVISSALMQTAHRNGLILFDLLEKKGIPWLTIESLRSIPHLEKMTLQIIVLLKTEIMQDLYDTRSRIVMKINHFITERLGDDLSLQAISEYMNLHPVYISKVYKKETGGNITAYILTKRMEQASHLLCTTNKKVNTIACLIGYSNPAYFIKVFKEYFNKTPQELRMGG